VEDDLTFAATLRTNAPQFAKKANPHIMWH